MRWSCKSCNYSSPNQRTLIVHYKLKHCHQARNCPLPCVYADCVCSFRTVSSLKKHLTRDHSQDRSKQITSKLNCELCSFSETCNDAQFFAHLKIHICNKETVKCPFRDCSFQSSVYSTFRAHKSKKHHLCTVENFRTNLYQTWTPDTSNSENTDIETHSEHLHLTDVYIEDQNLPELLQYKIATLLLRMQTALHVSKASTQEIINELCRISSVVDECTPKLIESVLIKHNCAVNSAITTAITEIIKKANPLSLLSKDGPFGSEYKRATFYKNNFKVIEPIEYVLHGSSGQKCVYIPILKVLTELLNRNDVLDKILETKCRDTVGCLYQYKTYRDGLYCKENILLSSEDLSIALGLYIDDFEVCNPLGTSKKKHKVCAVYWVISNLPIQYRSSVQSIYLACLCHSNDMKKYGYTVILEPLLKDLEVLEQQGLYVQRLGASIRGTVLYVSADNLGAHSLAGFHESFRVDKFCRFCLASREQIDIHEVKAGVFPLRTVETHKHDLLELKKHQLDSLNGVKRDCVLNRLSHFHTIQGFPPDFMHDLFEGIVPRELSLCIKSLISKKYFTVDFLNYIIESFPFKYTDKTNRPQKISQSWALKKSLGGNCHENWTLLRFLPLMIGHVIPEDDKTWQILLDLKEIVEILASGHFSEETLSYLECKISDHRCLLKEVFPEFHLLPKHHYLEHYPELIRRFGPLIDFWTIRFEAKHNFFKRVVHDCRNFKNILLTLATKHQLSLAYHLDLPSLFRPDLEVGHIAVVSPDILEHSMKKAVELKYGNITLVSLATHVCLYGTKYSEGMFLSVGHTSGLPDFGKLVKIVVVSSKMSFMIEPYQAWYMEHLRSYELVKQQSYELKIVESHELNAYQPLFPYTRAGKLLVTPKAFLLH